VSTGEYNTEGGYQIKFGGECLNIWGRTYEQDGENYIMMSFIIVLWHVDALLGYDSEINNYSTAVTKQRPINSNRGKVFSVRSVPRCYKQDKSGVAVN
jgi:hypothetical protein